MGEKLVDGWNASAGSLNIPYMTACGQTGAFPIIPKFWNRRNLGTNAIISSRGSARKTGKENPELKFGRGEWE
jgi:hypothetical protein